MKRFISVLLTVLMLCSALFLSACSDDDRVTTTTKGDGNGPTPEGSQKLVEDSIAKISDLDSYHAVMTQNINVSMQGISMEMPINVDIKVTGAKTDDVRMYAIQDMEMMGETLITELYIEGDYIYLDSDGYQAKISKDEIGDTDQLSYDKTVKELLQVLPDDVMKDVMIKYNDLGNRYVEVEFDSAKFLEFYKGNIEDVSSNLGISVDDLQINDSKVRVVIGNDGYVKEYTLTYKMAITISEQTASADVSLKIEFINPGKAVTITPMQGYKDFPLMDY